MRLAIVGGGIAGLVAAHLLHRDHTITLFEANEYPGGHTVPVRVGNATWEVDTGFIVVASQPSCMSFSVRADRTDFEYNGTTLNQLFPGLA